MCFQAEIRKEDLMTRARIRVLSALGAAGLIGGLLVSAQAAGAEEAPAKHVLLISVDGLHLKVEPA